MKRKAHVCLMTLVLSTFAWANPRIEVQGHRGARAVLPENTLEGFEYALRVGVDVLELDLAVTADRKVIISHDPMVNRVICVFDRKGSVAFFSLSLKEVKEIDCGSKKNPRFPKQRPVPRAKIPTLGELFEMVKASILPSASKVSFNMEIKMVPGFPARTPPPKEFARLVYNVIKAHGMVERSIIQSFDHRPLKAVKSLNPKLKTAFLNHESLPPFLPLAKSLGVDIISPNQHWITREEVKALKKARIKVIPWTANNRREWERLIKMGVDGIITDDPKALIDDLKKKGLRP
ncbi:MAG: glycerophosphodiester phosphodiesterase family protein [Bacteriovoracales bacterium]|nr:glycerophosphodiester phosphodiesterase family protein [Bacteriovoracales bacterium]